MNTYEKHNVTSFCQCIMRLTAHKRLCKVMDDWY